MSDEDDANQANSLKVYTNQLSVIDEENTKSAANSSSIMSQSVLRPGSIVSTSLEFNAVQNHDRFKTKDVLHEDERLLNTVVEKTES